MATKHGLPPDDRFPRIVSEYDEEPESPSMGMAWDIAAISTRILKTSLLVVTASMIAILAMGNPVALFDYVTASLVDISPFQHGSMPSIQSTAQSTAAQDLPPAAGDAPTRDEIAAAIKAAGQSQAEIRQPPVDAPSTEAPSTDAPSAETSSAETSSADASLKQFQAWAAEQDARAQNVEPGRDVASQVQDAPAQAPVQDIQALAAQDDRDVQTTSAVAPPLPKRRHVRRVQNARAEVRRDARGQVRPPATPATDVRPPDRPAQNTQAPTLLQSLGFHD
jgi:hypothetical protein